MRQFVIVQIVLIAWLAANQSALAEEATNKATPWKTISLNLGGFISETNSTVRLGTPAAGVDINVEDTLGLDSTSSAFRFDAFWRFTQSKRHRVDFSWFGLNRSGSTLLGRDIEINGTTYPAGTNVSSSFDFAIYKGSYSYSFFQDDRIDLAAGIGLYVAPISFDINASGLFTGTASQSVTAPLPVVSLRADFAITPKWFLKTNFDAFYLEIDDYKGVLTDVRVAVEYNAFKHFGIGLGFDSFSLDVEAQESTSVPGVDFSGSLGFDYAGILLYGKVYFD